MAETHHVAASAIGRLSMAPPSIWIVSGLPGERRRGVVSSLLGALPRAAHVDGDALAEAIASGRVLPGEEPQEESERQVELAIRNQCLLARSYAEAGFSPVLEYAVVTRHQLDAYRHYLAGGQVRFVATLAEDDASEPAALMREELAGIGYWAADADGAALVAAEGEAALP